MYYEQRGRERRKKKKEEKRMGFVWWLGQGSGSSITQHKHYLYHLHRIPPWNLYHFPVLLFASSAIVGPGFYCPNCNHVKHYTPFGIKAVDGYRPWLLFLVCNVVGIGGAKGILGGFIMWRDRRGIRGVEGGMMVGLKG